MYRPASLALGAFALAALVVPTGEARDADRHPNIEIILADDLGYGSSNSYGASERHIHTPGIDRLADQGRRITDANTTSSICSPARYSLLTGRYCWRTSLMHGVLGITSPLHIETGRPTIASFLRSAGYRTAAIGKWHLGYGTGRTDYTKSLRPGPLDLGFAYHFGVPQNHGDETGWRRPWKCTGAWVTRVEEGHGTLDRLRRAQYWARSPDHVGTVPESSRCGALESWNWRPRPARRCGRTRPGCAKPPQPLGIGNLDQTAQFIYSTYGVQAQAGA